MGHASTHSGGASSALVADLHLNQQARWGLEHLDAEGQAAVERQRPGQIRLEITGLKRASRMTRVSLCNRFGPSYEARGGVP